MIDNKLVTIKKENDFDKGWALFKPCADIPLINRKYQNLYVDEVVKKITYAQKIVLMLSEPCLPCKILDELKWVNVYSEIYLIAKTQKIIEVYKSIHFTDIKIDPSLMLNYIGITGKEEKTSYFISDGFQVTDDTAEQLYFSGLETQGLDLSALTEADKVIVLKDSYLSGQDQLFDFCEQNKIEAYLAEQITDFNKSVYDKYLNSQVNLITAQYIAEGICVEKQGKLFYVAFIRNKLFLVEVENFNTYFKGKIFINLKARVILSATEIPSNVYVLYNDNLNLLAQKDCLVIEKEISFSNMTDFIETRFDKSETEEHNNYSAIAKSVEYRFTLIPPLYSQNFVYSDIYNTAQSLLKSWEENYSLNIPKIKEELSLFEGNQLFMSMLQHIDDSNESVVYIIKNYQYGRYKVVFETCRKELENDRENIINYCVALYDSIAVKIRGTQNSKIDDEIAGYEKIIREKEEGIKQGIDVLQSKRRIEILKSKIADLLKIKQNFSSKQSEKNANDRDAFAAWCLDVLNGKISKEEEDSVASIVNKNEITKDGQVKNFLQRWLNPLKNIMEKLINLLVKMKELDVPENYVVYDNKGERFIVIDSENEYYQTLELCKRYKMQCVTRR